MISVKYSHMQMLRSKIFCSDIFTLAFVNTLNLLCVQWINLSLFIGFIQINYNTSHLFSFYKFIADILFNKENQSPDLFFRNITWSKTAYFKRYWINYSFLICTYCFLTSIFHSKCIVSIHNSSGFITNAELLDFGYEIFIAK